MWVGVEGLLHLYWGRLLLYYMKYIKKLDDNPFKNFTMEDYEVYCNKMELGYYSGSMII